ncbi:hypothetical protein [Nocardia bhagyanarayanae]|nr:hypothetical protein [Nocardia bhagyanarayanae]
MGTSGGMASRGRLIVGGRSYDMVQDLDRARGELCREWEQLSRKAAG